MSAGCGDCYGFGIGGRLFAAGCVDVTLALCSVVFPSGACWGSSTENGYMSTKPTDPSSFFFYRFLIAAIFLLSPKSHLLKFPIYKTGRSRSSQASHIAWGTTSFVPSFYTYVIRRHSARKTLSMVSLRLLYIAPTSESPSVHIYNMDYKVPHLLLRILYCCCDGSKNQNQTL